MLNYACQAKLLSQRDSPLSRVLEKTDEKKRKHSIESLISRINHRRLEDSKLFLLIELV